MDELAQVIEHNMCDYKRNLVGYFEMPPSGKSTKTHRTRRIDIIMLCRVDVDICVVCGGIVFVWLGASLSESQF